MSDQTPFRAFISYSHRDRSWGEWLHRRLESYRVPASIVGRDTAFGPIPAQLAPIFRDRDELATATDLSAEIDSALRNSMFLIVLCSPAAAGSRWVNEEIKSFKRLHGEGRVHALIVDGVPFSGDPATECFPEALRFRVGADGAMTTVPAEPIAADVRAEGDGKKYAVSKLVAGLTGARLDELVRREQQRRATRLRWIAAGVALLVLVLSALTFDALRQRNAARVAQTDAEFQRNEAQNLVEYMLTDLRDKLNAVGRLDVLESVGKRLAESYAKQDLSKLDADALGRRARVQLLLGEVDNTRGNLDSALTRYQEAAATTEEQLRRDPDNPQRIFDHAQSVYWVGYIAWQRGDSDAAKGYWTRYYDYAQRLVEIDPNNDEWQMEVNYANSNLGTLALDQGEASIAEEYFRKSLEVARYLSDKRPTDPGRIITQGQAFAWLADAFYFQAKLHDAESTRISEIAYYDRAAITNPNNADIIGAKLTALFSLAQIELSSNRLDEAHHYALEAATRANKLIALDPNNTEMADRAVFANAILGEVLFYLKNSVQAREALTRALRIANVLGKTNTSVVKWKAHNFAKAAISLARLDAAEHNLPAAMTLLDNVVLELGKIVKNNVADQIMIRRYCEALAERARLSPKFRDDWHEIIALLAPLQRRHGPDALALLAEAYEKDGLHSASFAIASKLNDAGFRHPQFLNLIKRFPALKQDQANASNARRP
ncbi:MAG: TIR domain-containing protein [Dokdonella sp.]|nr:TIR domain-containing protein [Dokdonella sp.]MCB1577265.1 TIR domain-containing protein [Xanthomonadales bacterium]